MTTSDIDTLTIGQAREDINRGNEIAKLFGGSNKTENVAAGEVAEVHGKQIVILDRGFVYVGDVTISGAWSRSRMRRTCAAGALKKVLVN